MKHADLTAGEHYAYDRTPKTAHYYSPSRVRLVSTDKYSPNPSRSWAREQVTITDQGTTVELVGCAFTKGIPWVAVCYDKPNKIGNYQLVPVSQLGSTWADWETTKAERDTAREASEAQNRTRREEQGRRIVQIAADLHELGLQPVRFFGGLATVDMGWVEQLILRARKDT